MANRGDTGMGVKVALGIFATLTLALFVLTVIFAAQANKERQERQAAEATYNEAIRPDERNDTWDQLRARAGRNQGVVMYLHQQNQELLNLIGASRRESSEAVMERVRGTLSQGSSTLLREVESLTARIQDLQRQVEAADRARGSAEADMLAAIERADRQQQANLQRLAENNAQLAELQAEVQRYREGADENIDTARGQVAEERATSSQRIAELESSGRQLRNQIAVLEEQLERLRGQRSDEVLTAQNEATLIDGRVVSISGADEVILDRGRRDRMVLGLTFEVYPRGTTLRADADGEFPPGKASLEVIRVDEGTSRARVIRSTRGNPVVAGDLLLNPIYDPNKVYKFVVFGNFDTNRDGVATEQERNQIIAMIQEWGGSIQNEIDGTTDFVVLGEPPILPPQPRQDDPIEVIDRYIQLRRTVDRFNELFESAKRAGIPVLNQNRLMTLTGMHAQPQF